MINKQKYKILSYLIILLFFLNISLSFADGMDITANLPSWTYDHVLKIILTPSIDNTKTFYSFNPDWTPADALLYNWPILIKKSIPLIFFSYLNTQVESKIKENDYIINYPNTINLSWNSEITWNKISWVFIINNDNAAIDLSFWELRKDGSDYIIPDWTILDSKKHFPIDNIFSWSWYISLFSPDWEKKDFIEIKKLIQDSENLPIKPDNSSDDVKSKKDQNSSVEIKSINTDSPILSETDSWTKTNNFAAAEINTDSNNNSWSENNKAVPQPHDEEIPKPANSIENTTWSSWQVSPEVNQVNIQKGGLSGSNTENSGSDLNNNLKNSLNETGVNSNWIIVFAMIGWLFIFWLIYQIYQKRKSLADIKAKH